MKHAMTFAVMAMLGVVMLGEAEARGGRSVSRSSSAASSVSRSIEIKLPSGSSSGSGSSTSTAAIAGAAGAVVGSSAAAVGSPGASFDPEAAKQKREQQIAEFEKKKAIEDVSKAEKAQQDELNRKLAQAAAQEAEEEAQRAAAAKVAAEKYNQNKRAAYEYEMSCKITPVMSSADIEKCRKVRSGPAYLKP